VHVIVSDSNAYKVVSRDKMLLLLLMMTMVMTMVTGHF